MRAREAMPEDVRPKAAGTTRIAHTGGFAHA